MINILCNNALNHSGELNVLFIVGIAVFFGTVAARIFQRLNIPKIIAYIVIGIILGPLLKIISPQIISVLEPFNIFALGIIGFLIGGELKLEVFKKFGKQVIAILLFEGLVAFSLVTGLTFLVMQFFVTWQIALAVAFVFGAICSATDPASTTSVLWEYKTRGPLTTMLIAIVALDDALALFLYIASISIATVLTGHNQQISGWSMALNGIYEIFGSLILGVVAGLVLRWIIKKIRNDEAVLAFSIGSITLTIGLAKYLEMDVILSAMAAGVTMINTAPRQSKKSFELIRKFSPPIYVLFFVIIGSRLNISTMNAQIAFLVAAYIIGSIIGKAAGAYMGAIYSKATPVIKKYLGFCLYQQGTIAIALLMMASGRFEGQIRDTMLAVIIIGVFVLQLIGPFCLRASAQKAGEVGLNITEEDLIKTYSVADIMETEPTNIPYDLPLHDILEVFSTTDSIYYPVVDANRKIVGNITIAGIKEMFANQDVAAWLLACDVAEPVLDKTTANTLLEDAMERMKRYDLETIPVVDNAENDQVIGVLDYRLTNRKISAEVLRRRKLADGIHL